MQTWKLEWIGQPTIPTRQHIRNSFKAALLRLEPWIQQSLVPALVYGGLGIQGIAQTTFYTFITSNEGLSQLGIRREDPPKLLQAYLDSHKLIRKGTFLELRFGHPDKLIKGTRHWAHGTGLLRIGSWMNWVLKDEIVQNFGFVTRAALPKWMQRRPRLKAPLGGLMLNKDRPIGGGKTAALLGNKGHWEFPNSLKDYYVTWFTQNQAQIAKAIEDRFVIQLQRSLNA